MCHCGCKSLEFTDHCVCCLCEEFERTCDHRCEHDGQRSFCDTMECVYG
jgi:hypothetical protein